MGLESDLMELGLTQIEDGDFGGMMLHSVGNVNYDYPICLGIFAHGGRIVEGGISTEAEMSVTVRKSVVPAGLSFRVGQNVVVTLKNGTTHNLKISKEGVRDVVYAYELMLSSRTQGI